ncbi:hypothetical protein CISIN_1g000754mg [Citrus sinensis]|uniref:Time for coffee n=2 Tax=Citrus sinensis TaxID=2711 RepID=A0A067FZW2_CITSI|nr:hypothetical protein CISIN_1g000754mg [Citrus sinensis]
MLMERSREARRSNMAASNGLARRRQRSTSLRESHAVEEDSQMVLQDTVRLRDRAKKRDRDRERERERDREFSNHHKRRRGDSLTVGEEERSEESVPADEEDFVIEERRVAHAISHNNTSLSSSSLSNQNSRKSLPPTRLPVKQAPALKAADELIGALVPRKARSASVKRSHESWLSGNGGFWEDQKASSTSPASRSTEANSPSSSNVSIRKKMKLSRRKTRLPKVAKCFSPPLQQDDIEIEIAEVLFGLMKQSQDSNKEDDSNTTKLESIDDMAISQNTKSSVSVLPQSNIPAPDLLLGGAAQKKKNVEVDNSSNPFCNASGSSSTKVDSKMETSAPKSEQTATHEVDAFKVASMAVEPQEEVTEQGDSKLSIQGPGSPDGPVTEKKSISSKEESATCLKMDVDFPDSTVTKGASIILENDGRKEEKFKIDLMAPPPMVSSPEREGFNDFAPDPSFEANDVKMKSLVKDEEKTDRFLKEELVVKEVEEKKIHAIGDKRQLKIDLEKPNQDNGRDSSITSQQASQKQHQPQSKSTIAKVEKTGAESSSIPLKVSVPGWPNGLQPLGYLPPFQTMTPIDSSTISATAQQHSSFMLSQPQSKRCATHCYIARNIYLNQQLEKMNPFWSAGASSDSLCGAKPNNPSAMPSTENIIHGSPLQGSCQLLNLHSGRDKGQAVASFPHPAQKDKSSEGVNFMDPAQNKQLVLQQAPQLPPAGNLLHASALIFRVSQQQAAVTAAANQPGPSKSAVTSTKSASVSGNSTAAPPATTVALPPAVSASAVGYNFPNLAGNETPYLTILQNNGYQFPVPTPIGTAPVIRGGTHAQALPFFNGSFYSPQIFHPSQLYHQQQPHSQSIMQAAHQNTSTSSASSSSHKQLHNHQSRGMSVIGNNFVSSMTMQSQQTQKQHVSSSNQNHKLEAEMSGENTPSVANSRLSHNQTSVYGQNFTVPLQPLNFQLMPSSAVGGSTGATHNEKQQQSQQKSVKGGVELIPQAFAMSFTSSGTNSPSNLNFSHNPAIFQSLPDMARYQVVPAAQAAPQKNHQITEVKTGGSSKHDEGKKPGLGKSSASNVQTLVFDNSARTLNFDSSPITGNWPSCSITSTTITTNVPIAANLQNFQQQQLLQLQQQQMLQQQQQSTAAARSKAQTTKCLPSSSIGAKLSNKAPTFSQTLVQSNSSSQSPQWKNSARNPTNQVPPTSLTSSGISNIKNVSQQQVRSSQGHTQISFERHFKSGLAPQGQQITTSNLSPTRSKAGSSILTLQSQPAENSSASAGQKSSPVCGRNVPSILSTCPSHLSELKY